MRWLAGPLLVWLLVGLGMACGYHVGFVAACIVVPAVALALAFLVARRASTSTALLACVLATALGIVSARQYRNLKLLDSGVLAPTALADLPRRAHAERIALRAGEVEAHAELAASASKSVLAAGPRERTRRTDTCEAYPITPRGWRPESPITIWRYGEAEASAPLGLDRAIFAPRDPDELCRTAIARATSLHHLTTAPGAIYLEARPAESSDRRTTKLSPLFGGAFASALWIGVVAGIRAKEALARRRA